jgi:hypothetical protein
MSVDEKVGVDSDHRLPQPIDEVSDGFPVAFGHPRLTPFAFERVLPQTKHVRRLSGQPLPQRFVDEFKKGLPLFAGRARASRSSAISMVVFIWVTVSSEMSNHQVRSPNHESRFRLRVHPYRISIERALCSDCVSKTKSYPWTLDAERDHLSADIHTEDSNRHQASRPRPTVTWPPLLRKAARPAACVWASGGLASRRRRQPKFGRPGLLKARRSPDLDRHSAHPVLNDSSSRVRCIPSHTSSLKTNRRATLRYGRRLRWNRGDDRLEHVRDLPTSRCHRSDTEQRDQSHEHRVFDQVLSRILTNERAQSSDHVHLSSSSLEVTRK